MRIAWAELNDTQMQQVIKTVQDVKTPDVYVASPPDWLDRVVGWIKEFGQWLSTLHPAVQCVVIVSLLLAFYHWWQSDSSNRVTNFFDRYILRKKVGK